MVQLPLMTPICREHKCLAFLMNCGADKDKTAAGSQKRRASRLAEAPSATAEEGEIVRQLLCSPSL
jgi:hypothetical protein